MSIQTNMNRNDSRHYYTLSGTSRSSRLLLFVPIFFLTGFAIMNCIAIGGYLRVFKLNEKETTSRTFLEVDDSNDTITVTTDNTNSKIHRVSHDHTANFTVGSGTPSFTKLWPSDAIYSRDWWEKPMVNEEFKLIFFSVPKVACTEWKLLFRRMSGLDYQPGEFNVSKYQNPELNSLKTLDQYPLDRAEEMMNSPEWTRAMFIREPKERILSAFLNKFVVDRFYFRQTCCNEDFLPQKWQRIHCDKMMNRKDLKYFLERTQDCKDPHWQPQWITIDEKWWKAINFIGHMESISDDVKRLLQSISSASDGVSAWEKYGKSGWGTNGTQGFMQKNSAGHSANAAERLCQYYTPEDEQFVEKHWSIEWKHHEFMDFELKTICNGTKTMH